MTNNEEKRQRYEALVHAMQTGVAYVQAKDASDGTPKHLRVGINSAMVEHAALVDLLIQKNVITDEEYVDALIAGMEREVERYQQEVRQLYGSDSITLG